MHGSQVFTDGQYVERLCALGPRNKSQAYWLWLWDLLAPPYWGPQAPRCWLPEVAALSNQLQLESHLLCRMMSVIISRGGFNHLNFPTHWSNKLWNCTTIINLLHRFTRENKGLWRIRTQTNRLIWPTNHSEKAQCCLQKQHQARFTMILAWLASPDVHYWLIAFAWVTFVSALARPLGQKDFKVFLFKLMVLSIICCPVSHSQPVY